MEIRTEPATELITVRDLDVSLGPGDVYPLTAWPDDKLTIADDGGITLHVAKTGEQIVILARHVRWYSLRTRPVKVPVPPAPTPATT